MRRIIKIYIAIHVALAALWLMLGHEAHADRDEASLHAHVQFGRATVGEIDAPAATDSAPFVGVGARATYAISNWYAFEASLGYGQLRDWTLHTVDTEQGAVMRNWYQTWMQANLGITGRFGVRIVPTLHAALGVQHRVWQRGRQNEEPSRHCMPRNPLMPETCDYNPVDRAKLELVGTLGAGLDYRFGDRWLAGMAVTTQRAALVEAGFSAVAVTFHFSYYFYPEGAGP